ncbi:VOC family protein [Phyllobacterium sp. TAF24]|jgi:PhnB protein|uniref:VOC family protein n=1 Tax=unclassified Phyllobacterium TaxID=2638441 RepID=UPI000882D20A|nr:VOC family protein [Phyllobacterium sp. OV277]SDN80767.1 PhnB protein [Phyllobacterium sp. OV277]
MKINAYLNFDGQCEEAFKFYEKVLNGQIQYIARFGDMPEGAGMPGAENQVMHVHMTVGNAELMGSDAPPPYFEKAQGMHVALHPDSAEEAERIFAGLSDGARVTAPIGETSWAIRFGMLVDRYGTPWIINFAKPM